MRFVDLRPSPVGDGIELHPRITVLRGLDPAARVAMVGFVHAVAGGETFEWTGTVEVHGIVMTLERALDLLGATSDAALIVEATNLLEVTADPAAAGSEAARDHQSAVDACQTIEDAIADLAEELSGSGRIRSDMQARLAATTARVDSEAGARLDRADGALARAARLADRPDPWTGMGDVSARIEQLESLVQSFDAHLSELPAGDRPSLAAAVAAARAALSNGSVQCPESAALAAAWSSLHQRLVGLESRMEAAGGGTEALAARLDAARAAARAAEDAAVPRSVLPEEAAELERLHERVLELEARSGRSMRRGASKKEFAQAKTELNDALEAIGYPTWAAFRMGNGMASVSPERLECYERSRAELEAAEIEWAELMARLERDTELQSVLNAIDQALDRAVDLLGADPYADSEDDDPDVLVGALLANRVEAASVGAGADDALGHLRATLDAAHAVGHQDLHSDAALIALGDTWSAVLAAADDAAVRILRDRERAAAELRELILLGDGSRVDRLDEEREAMWEAEGEVAEMRDALLEVTRIRLELHMLAATELTLAEEHDAKLELLEGAKVLERLAEHRFNRSSDGPRGIEAVTSRIPRGRGGAIPLVVLMGDAPLEALDTLLGLPDDVQTMVIGDTAGLAEWAADQEYGTARCIEVPAFV